MPSRAPRQIREFFTTEQGLVDMMYGLGVGDNERERIVDDGFGSIKEILAQYEHDIEAFRTYLKTLNRTFGSSSDQNRRVYFPPPVMSRFFGAVYYGVISYYSCHLLPDFSMLTPDYAVECCKYYETRKNDENPETGNEIELEIPDFKGASNWRSFRDIIQMKLGLIKGRMSYPIDYVIDMTDRNASRANAARTLIDIVPITEDGYLQSHTVHFGDAFKEDNKRVWNLLKAQLHETSAYDRIMGCNKKNDGRKAWIILKNFYEGEDFQQRLQDEAFAILNSTVYRGESLRYNFESYVNRHIKGHKLLIAAEYNKDETTGEVLGMSETTKIQHFKTGIKLEAGLEQTLSAARTNGIHKKTFTDYVSYLQSEVDAKNLRKKELKASSASRNVSQVDHEIKNVNNDVTSQIVDGKRVEAKRYSKDEWTNLTRNQRRAVVQMNHKLRKKKTNNTNKKGKNNSIKAIRSSMKEDLIAVGDAIIAKISGVSNDNEDIKQNENEDENENQKSKRKVNFGGVGEMLAKRRRS